MQERKNFTPPTQALDQDKFNLLRQIAIQENSKMTSQQNLAQNMMQEKEILHAKEKLKNL